MATWSNLWSGRRERVRLGHGCSKIVELIITKNNG
jgi:hypothetical protein